MLLTAWCAQRTGEASWATTLLTCPAHDRERRNHFRSTSEYLFRKPSLKGRSLSHPQRFRSTFSRAKNVGSLHRYHCMDGRDNLLKTTQTLQFPVKNPKKLVASRSILEAKTTFFPVLGYTQVLSLGDKYRLSPNRRHMAHLVVRRLINSQHTSYCL